MISIDQTLIFQVIGFFVLLIILNRLLYKPVLEILRQRDEKIAGTLEKAASVEKEVEDALVDYDRKLKEAAVRGHEARAQLKQQGVAREKELIEAARADATTELGRMRGELEENKAAAVASLKEEAKSISADIASKILERKVLVAAFAMLLPLLPAIAGASDAEHGAGGGSAWKMINFVILVIGVVLAWTKGIKPLLEKRGADIKQAIEEAQSAKDAADKKALEYREKLSMLERKVEEIHTELKLEGEAEKDRIIAEAEAAAVKIRAQAKLTAEQEVKKAKLEIRREVANLAAVMAKEIIEKELKPEDQQRLVKGYLDNLRLN